MERGIAVIIILTLFSGGVPHLNAQEKSTGLAMGLSLGVPLASFAAAGLIGGDAGGYLAIVGFAVGPSTGHYYADQWNRGLLFTGLRCGIGVLAILGGTAASGGGSTPGPEVVFAYAGTIGVLVVTIIDVASVPKSVREYNESLKTAGAIHFIPRIDLKNERYGISVVYHF
jgi:hypothetical protein